MNKGSKEAEMREGSLTIAWSFFCSKIFNDIIERKITREKIKSDLNSFSLRTAWERKTRTTTPHPANEDTM